VVSTLFEEVDPLTGNYSPALLRGFAI